MTTQKPWPRLTTDLTGPDRPELCRCCGDPADDLWQEHDDHDRPELRHLWLCEKCSDRIVEPHARLYTRIDRNKPAPGAMRLCVDCRHRAPGGVCANPGAKANGGPGIIIRGVRGAMGFIDGQDKRGRRWGHRFVSYPLPPGGCDGKEKAPPHA